MMVFPLLLRGAGAGVRCDVYIAPSIGCRLDGVSVLGITPCLLLGPYP